MIPPGIPPELLDKTPHELLDIIVAGKYGKDVLSWARERIKELWGKKEYGFTPEPELAFKLQKISKSEAYKRMKECIGNHHFLSLVKLGLIFAEISEEGEVEKIARIKSDVHEKYGIKGVRILSMGSTGVLLEVIRYLSDIKIKHNYSQADMAGRFEKIVDKWMEIAIFHKAEDGQTTLRNKIIGYMQTPHELFFVFASGSAGDQAKRVIADLSNNNEIRKRGYLCTLLERKEDMTGRELYT